MVFDVRDEGPRDGEAIVLLHGFPETSTCWDEVTPILNDSGYRTLAPDQRGYSGGARPVETEAYDIDELVGDVLGLARAAGVSRFHLVGHDLGAILAWIIAGREPRRVRTLTAISVPHPRAMARSMLTSFQALKSAYVAFFQLPLLPERLLLARDGLVLRRSLVRSGLSKDRADQFVSTMLEPGALSGALNWYRAGRARPSLASTATVTVPSLYIWGSRDGAVSRTAAHAAGRHVSGPFRFEPLQGVSHWVPEEEPLVVADLVLRHVA